jgi:hypothetical protein
VIIETNINIVIIETHTNISLDFHQYAIHMKRNLHHI